MTEGFFVYAGNNTEATFYSQELLDPVWFSAFAVGYEGACQLKLGGEELEALNITLITWLALALALGLSFLSLKAGAYMWFVSCWPWVALATLVSITWLQGIAILMAVVCLGLFVVGISGKSRGR
jgi:hypothetical protein